MKIFIFALCCLSFSINAAVDLVRVDKSARKMYLMEGNKVVRQYHIALGANPGHKTQEGDKKTPEGLYQLDYINQNSSFYRSMHISYPNDHDRRQAQKRGVSPGGDIMIHGQKNGYDQYAKISQRYNWTDGCIALKNWQMDEFLTLVPVGTHILIKP